MFLFLGVFRLLFGRLSPSASCSPVCFVCDDSPAVGCGGDTSVALISAAASNSLSGLAHVGRRGRHAPPSPLAWAARAWRRRGQAGDTLRPKLRSWGRFSDIPAFGVDRGRKRAGRGGRDRPRVEYWRGRVMQWWNAGGVGDVGAQLAGLTSFSR